MGWYYILVFSKAGNECSYVRTFERSNVRIRPPVANVVRMKVNIHMCSQHFISIRTNKGYVADVLLDLEVFGMTGSTGHYPEVEKIKIQLAPITNTLL